MGRTYKDESFGADGKFRNRRRNSEKRQNATRQNVNQKPEPVFSDGFEIDQYENETQSKGTERNR